MRSFMYFWSWLFSPLGALALYALFALTLSIKKRFRDALTVCLAGAATTGVVQVLKQLIGRPRPQFDSALWASESSFPSGHAAAAVCFSILLIRFFTDKKHKFFAIVFTAIIVLLVGASRVYFGVHYVSDVIAGYALGAIVALTALVVDSRIKIR